MIDSLLVHRILTAAALVGCAPSVDGPVERQRALDRADSAQLAAQLRALPGVENSEVVLHRAARDPLALQAAPAGGSIVVVVDDRTDRAAMRDTAGALARAIAPELEPTIVVAAGAPRIELAKVGPFEVATGSRAAVRATLLGALAVIAVLAVWLARGYRRGKSAQ